MAGDSADGLPGWMGSFERLVGPILRKIKDPVLLFLVGLALIGFFYLYFYNDNCSGSPTRAILMVILLAICAGFGCSAVVLQSFRDVDRKQLLADQKRLETDQKRLAEAQARLKVNQLREELLKELFRSCRDGLPPPPL
jgi:hypothetical protein